MTAYLLQKMRCIISAAVDQRAESGSHLCHRDIETLPEAVSGQIGSFHISCFVQQACRASLTRHIDAGILAETEDMLVFCKRLRSKFLRDLHQRDITGLGHGVFHGDSSVSAGIMAMDQMVIYLECSGTVIGLIALDGRSFQSCRHSKRFKCRTRLIRAGDAVIIPKAVHRLILFFVIHAFDLLFGICLIQISGLIRIKHRVGRLRQDLTVVRIHNDHAGIGAAFPALSRMFVIELFDLLFDDRLYIDIDRCHEM